LRVEGGPVALEHRLDACEPPSRVDPGKVAQYGFAPTAERARSLTRYILKSFLINYQIFWSMWELLTAQPDPRFCQPKKSPSPVGEVLFH
jgi:hypothetical protein